MEGKVIAGRYRLLQQLGYGAMGSVWQAQHLELETKVAVKLMDPSLANHPEGLLRFRREAQAAASLRSPNVVKVYDYGVDGDVPYIVMELLEGESLADRLLRENVLSIEATSTILSQVARAISKAHEVGIIHRDLKPDNIFLAKTEEGEGEVVKVLDFGIAKCMGDWDRPAIDGMRTQAGLMLGTPFYMSPEQASGQKDTDHRSDIWSFGVVACECVTGMRVFEADTLGGVVLVICSGPMPVPSQVGPAPDGFDAWFARCAARERSERFQTIREAALALAALCEHFDPEAASIGCSEVPVASRLSAPTIASGPTSCEPVSVADPSTLSEPRKSGARTWWRGAAVGLLLGGGLVAAAVIFQMRHDEAPVSAQGNIGSAIGLTECAAVPLPSANGVSEADAGTGALSEQAVTDVPNVMPVAASLAAPPAASSARPKPVAPTKRRAARPAAPAASSPPPAAKAPKRKRVDLAF